jgi:eukaryotic-like serine/threonine-protein kinase
MASATGLRKKLNPALLAGAPYREGELMADRYLVRDAVGVGPLGFVLRTSDRELGIDVSVKLIHPRFVQTNEERDAFRQALEPARRFLHPSLTRLHDVGIDQGWPYFTYTFLDGLPLRRIIDLRLAKGQTFALDEVEPILGQLMAALEAAHPAGAHGGLKAENILVLPDMLKVTDWGVAAGMPRPPFVQAERQKAAHRHLAPEYLAGLALEPRADVYALGVLVGEMLTGLTPEDEIPELRLVNPALPDAVEGFYRRALSERPESRFRSVREMFEAFLAVVEGKPLGATPQAVAPSADAVAEDGFEVDFVEAQTTVVQPEPVADVPRVETAPPVAAAGAASLDTLAPPVPAAVELPAEASAATSVAAPEVVPPSTAAEPVTVAPPSEAPAPSAEVPFWSEADPVASAPPVSTPPAAETLWSDEEEEVEADDAAASPGEAVAPVLSLAQPAEDVAQAIPPAPSLAEGPPEVAPPPARPLPVVPRIGVPALTVPPAGRPSVPAVGLWGPGARRTGAHAAVAVALPESPSSVAPLAPPPVAPPESRAAVPPPPAVRPLPTPALLRPVEPPPPAPAAAAAAVERGHQGGVWSPGAALAELVSELRAEDAQSLVAAEADAAPAAKAAQAVTEQRASRERLALMSASEEPTLQMPAVSGRPRKVALEQAAASPAPQGPKFWQRTLVQYAGAAVVVFLVGVLAAVLLLKVH